MSDRVLLTVIGLMVGFASFAAVGAATSLLMAEVQERATPQIHTLSVGYAQIRADSVAR